MTLRSIVPCNGCTACCHGDLIPLHPECGDDAANYETDENINPITKVKCRTLKKTASGDCFYLGEHGCTIHERAPYICREFDCRRFVRTLRKNKEYMKRAIANGMVSKEVIKAGRDRLHTLPHDLPRRTT